MPKYKTVTVTYERKRCVNYDTKGMQITETFEVPENWTREQVEEFEGSLVDDLMNFVDGIIEKH